MGARVAVDIGGTFTDLVLETANGQVTISKVLSTPDDLVIGVLDAVRRARVELSTVDLFIHGTTAGLNTFLERSGANVALVTTRGFRDAYVIGRGHRPDMYDLRYRKPAALLERDSIFEIDERLDGAGSVVRPLDMSTVDAVAKEIADADFDSVAVCLIHAYLEPAHEVEVRTRLTELLPGVPIVVSHEVAPEWREYERTSTTVTSAYITPKVRSYLQRISDELGSEGLRVPLHVTQSNGGAMDAASAAERAVLTLFSGPVGGVVGGREVGRVLDEPNLICIDMGGTSFDVSLVRNGEVGLQSEFELQGLSILAPAVELVTIGAGGGSLIQEHLGGLRVGPESAGSSPGPAAYGRGGTKPTVSDANVVLGRLPANQRLAGDLSLDVNAARRAVEAVAEKLELSPIELAAQALDVTHFAMAEAIRELTVERGLDPKDFAIVAFGGAGPLHAAYLAEELEIDRIIVPAAPGVFSAWGMLQGDIRQDIVSTFYRDFDEADPDLGVLIDDLQRELVRRLDVDPEIADIDFESNVDLRYVGQEYSLLVPLAGRIADAELADAFHSRYKQRYGHANPDAPIEFVAVRVAAIVAFDRPENTSGVFESPGGGASTQSMYSNGVMEDVPVIDRSAIGDGVDGPAIVTETSATIVVPRGWSIEALDSGHALMERTGSTP